MTEVRLPGQLSMVRLGSGTLKPLVPREPNVNHNDTPNDTNVPAKTPYMFGNK